MAQTLVEDRAYHLTGDENVDGKCFYSVKLTDSCLKAIEQYIIHKNTSRSQPRIKFDGQNGTISIPGKSSSEKKFHFGVSALSSGQGAIECIKHPDRKSNQLISYGSLVSKISINATEDVYENTAKRMAQVDQERKDVRTKEIDFGNMKKRKQQTKTKIITPDSHKHTHNSSSNSSSSSSFKKKLPAPTPNHSSPSQSVSSTSRSSPAMPNRNNAALAAAQAAGKSFTCRERVVHILALRPHKKPELIQRLTREAMSQKDRNNLAMVIQQVSSIQDNQHKLHAHLYNDINVDTWPFYNENERTIVKKNIATHRKQQQTSSPQQVSSTSKSPAEEKQTVKPSSDEKPEKAHKRSHTDKDHSPHNNKRQKTNYEEPTSTVSSSNNKTISEDSTPSPKKNAPSPTKSNAESTATSTGEESPPTVASTSKTPEYLKQYKPIRWKEQRRQYKTDFETEYPVYLRLKEKVDAVKIKFKELQEEYNGYNPGTPEHQYCEKKIIEAYEKLERDDDNYHEQRRKYEELEQKLRYIKKLVVEYDQSMMNE
eukprot:TCONS_00012042-protein